VDLTRYPFTSIARHPGRSFGLALICCLISAVTFGAATLATSLATGLTNLEARLGADVIVCPKTAKSTHDLEAVLVEGVPGSFYMDRSVLSRVETVEGVEAVSPQYYLATVKAGCCTMPIQIIGIDPTTDFTIQPWIDHSLGHDLKRGEVVVGANITGAPGSTIRFYGRDCTIAGKLDETGTSLDTCAFCDAATIADLIEGSIEQGIAVLTDMDPQDAISTVQVKVKDGVSAEKVAGDINVHVRDVWAVSGKAMTQGVASGMAGTARIIRIAGICVGLAAVCILALALGIIARGRTDEFGILRILGASRAELVRTALTESLVLAAGGSLLGVVATLLVLVSFSGALESALGLPFLLPSFAGLGSTGLVAALVSVAVAGLVSALFAHRLSRVDPAAILREG